MSKEENIKKGIKLYDNFIQNICPYKETATPKTNTLELFGFLQKDNREQLIAEMCREFITNFDEGFFIENDELKQKITLSISITDNKIN